MMKWGTPISGNEQKWGDNMKQIETNRNIVTGCNWM